MKVIKPYWLEAVDDLSKATPRLGFWLAGSKSQKGKRPAGECKLCGGPLHLLAVYQKSRFIPLERFEAAQLLMCPVCSKESDGFEGHNGFEVRMATPMEAKQIESLRTVLRAPKFFRAEPTGEPTDTKRYESWSSKRDNCTPKLGGRQESIQSPRSLDGCGACGKKWRFVGSIPEWWGGETLYFGYGMGYTFVCSAECSPDSAFFYWDCA